MKKYIIIYTGQDPFTEFPYETKFSNKEAAIACARDCADMYDLEQGSQEVIEITINTVESI